VDQTMRYLWNRPAEPVDVSCECCSRGWWVTGLFCGAALGRGGVFGVRAEHRYVGWGAFGYATVAFAVSGGAALDDAALDKLCGAGRSAELYAQRKLFGN